ncbi:hypothetical protein M1116_00215 [Patescibacteria group bacterium]|nr:hypothetical protein [Patescibacteria group bacterium]
MELLPCHHRCRLLDQNFNPFTCKGIETNTIIRLRLESIGEVQVHQPVSPRYIQELPPFCPLVTPQTQGKINRDPNFPR